jgi:hypothetical protein
MSSTLDTFVGGINDKVAELLDTKDNFLKYQLHRVGTNALRQGTQNQVFPVVFTKKGEGKYIGVDDLKTMIAYHKVNRMDIVVKPRSGYGDGKGKMVNRYSMTMVVFLQRVQTKMEGHEFVLWLESVFPKSLKFPNFDSVEYTINNVILNEQQVFGAEYKNVQYFVKPEHALMAINYTIESTFKSECFNELLSDTSNQQT